MDTGGDIWPLAIVRGSATVTNSVITPVPVFLTPTWATTTAGGITVNNILAAGVGGTGASTGSCGAGEAGDIKLSGIKNGTLCPGQQVVLTRNRTAKFSDINPASGVAVRHTVKVPMSNGLTAYVSEFSIVSALSTGNLYGRLMQSAIGRAALSRILRTAACVQMVTDNHTPYATSRATEH